jgi:hypothetical protein
MPRARRGGKRPVDVIGAASGRPRSELVANLDAFNRLSERIAARSSCDARIRIRQIHANTAGA